MTKKTGGKLGAALICLIFALGFGGFGLFALSLAVKTGVDWLATRDWVETPATVVEARLHRNRSSKSTTYRAEARYVYRWEGRVYEGTRIGLHGDMADNVGNWHEDWHRKLARAKKRNAPIAVWVDPAEPAQAVVDRDLRWSMALFMLPFAILFPAIGFGALWAFVQVLKQDGNAPPPERGPPPANPVRMTSSARWRSRQMWRVAVFWNLIAFPIAGVVFADGFRPDLRLLVLVFPAIGLFLLAEAVRASLDRRRMGEWQLTLSPQQPVVGRAFRGSITSEKMLDEPAFSVALRCERIDDRGEHTRSSTLWEKAQHVHPVGNRLEFSFLPAADQPPSDASQEVYHRWRLVVHTLDGGSERSFDLTMGAGDGAPGATPWAEDGFGFAADPLPIPDSLATLTSSAEGLVVAFAPRRSRRLAWGLMLFGALFGAPGLWLAFQPGKGAPAVIVAALTLIGLGLMGLGLRLVHRPLTVTVGPNGLRVVRGSLWGVREASADPAAVSKIVASVGYSTSSGHDKRDYYTLHAHTRDGRKIKVGDGIPSRALADALIERMQAASGPSRFR